MPALLPRPWEDNIIRKWVVASPLVVLVVMGSMQRSVNSACVREISLRVTTLTQQARGWNAERGRLVCLTASFFF